MVEALYVGILECEFGTSALNVFIDISRRRWSNVVTIMRGVEKLSLYMCFKGSMPLLVHILAR